MSVEVQVQQEGDTQDATLASDPRWLLVQRILASEGFRRAGQLRKLLLHVSRSAILAPGHTMREYEIACEVLDRRSDFDPTNDNIVRAQFTHLRRKLERYFETDGRDEPILLTIPKGSYQPLFVPVEPPASVPPDDHEAHASPALSDLEQHADLLDLPTEQPPRRWKIWHLAAAGFSLALLIIVGTLYVHNQYLIRTKPDPLAAASPFVQFLARFDGTVEVVVPDTSEMIIRLISGMDISAVDYGNRDFSEKQIASVKDPAVREVLEKVAIRRNTTITEAEVAFDTAETLNRADIRSKVVYARDLHVRDLNEGSAILIGSRNSDPWISRFIDKTNFRFSQDGDRYFYDNIAPLPGEQRRYDIIYASSEHDAVSYAEVAFLPNASQSGYILLIIGSDSESNEATLRFLMHGRLPVEITSLLARKDLHSFEIFLRGKHSAGEANDSLEVVTYRPR